MSEEDRDLYGPDNSTQYQPKLKKQNTQKLTKQSSVKSDDLIMDIEAGFAGIIIGKWGIKIKKLNKQTGAFISVSDGKTDELKTVKISGDEKAKIFAQKLINSIIHEKKIKQKLLDLMKEKGENLKKNFTTLPPIIKDFYKEHSEVSIMSDQEAEDFRLSKNNIIVKYIDDNNIKPILKPVKKFSHAFQDFPEILEEIKKQNYEIPLPVQCQTWPILMSGHDLLAISQTGSGKTLAYLLPALIHIDFQTTPRNKRKGPSILLLAPTRELVLQIESEVKKYNYKGIKVMSVYGGASSKKQRKHLQNGVEIVIATPGRLSDFVVRGSIDLSDVTFLVIDEADRMLDLGFEPQIHVSLLQVRPDRQTIMTSATWPSEVQRLAKSYTTNPIQIMVGSLDLTTVNTVKQDVLIMLEEEKEPWLDDFLKNRSKDDKIIIFVNRKVTVDKLTYKLCLNGYNIEFIHGGREQCDRVMALKRFRNGEVSILLATNVVSRGIDIVDIAVVINYDFTKDIEEYVHRVGRTGRAGKTGLAISLLTRKDWGKAKCLIEVMEKSGQYVPPMLQDMARQFEAQKEEERAEGDERPYPTGSGGGNTECSGSVCLYS